ncbi:venom allergen 5-like [Trichogramma pretiosum]|uniref:venom allergen 5-like n=1 Tax=Trichogramma pretiosum TaxID=7493 RepID=UPI000C71A664|nr:venom allergen 5-like [Trichogramma pretiosum]
MLLKLLACALALVLVSDLTSAQWRGRQVQLQEYHDVCMASNSPFRVANGQEAGQPAATNMKMLKWDDKLARTAQNLANACIFQHDSCRHYPDLLVGQNMGWKWINGKINKDKLLTLLGGKIEESINDWYNEVRNFNPANVISYQKNPAVGHYTQLVWAETNRIGCGAVKYSQGVKHNLMLVCNYAPSGNIGGMPVYKTSN